jgi:glycosyltransferase involved in cell wall biosynthesis
MGKPLCVLHLAKVHAAQIQGGPGSTVNLLMQQVQKQTAKSEFAMSAVFDDDFILSYEDFIPKMHSLDEHRGDSILPRLAKRIFPRTFRFCAGVAFSTLRFLFHMEQAVRKTRRSHHIIFHSHDLISAYLCRLRYRRKYPLIFTIHGKGGYVREPMLQYPAFRGTFVERALRAMEARIIKRADIVAFPSNGARTLFEAEYPGLLQGKDVRIVHSGVDTAELDSVPGDANLLAKYGIGQETFVVLCIGALIKDKGIDTLVEAIALLPEDICSRLSCLVVGRGQLEGQLQSLIAAKGLHGKVRLLGFLPRQELLQLMRASTVFVLPVRVSVFDRAIQEAAAMGLPIVTTAVGGNLEMFDENSALLVPPDEPQALTTAITRVLTDGELRKQLSESVYHRVRNMFSLESMLNSYSAIYGEFDAVTKSTGGNSEKGR